MFVFLLFISVYQVQVCKCFIFITVEIKLGETGCVMTGGLDSCEDPNANCNGETICVCDVGYYDDSGNSNSYGVCQHSK